MPPPFLLLDRPPGAGVVGLRLGVRGDLPPVPRRQTFPQTPQAGAGVVGLRLGVRGDLPRLARLRKVQ